MRNKIINNIRGEDGVVTILGNYLYVVYKFVVYGIIKNRLNFHSIL